MMLLKIISSRNRIMLLVMVACVLCGTPAWAVPGPVSGGKYNIPLSGEPSSLDPAYITDIYAVNVANNLFDGLVEYDKDLNIVPAIADIWKIARDHKSYTFLLRKDIRFHNGRIVTADDFVFSFRRILDPATGSPVASFFMNIEGAKAFSEGSSDTVSGLIARDPHTLIIRLEEPYAPFLSILAMANAKVVPKEAMGVDFSKKPIGTGPFRFESWEPGKSIILSANGSYFGGRPHLDSLYFQIYPNNELERIFDDFERGYLEESIIPSDKYEMIHTNPNYTQRYNMVSKPSLNLVYIGINVKIPPLDNVKVRQAISCAVDTDTIVKEITKRGNIRAKGILPPGIAGFNPDFKGYTYNLDMAKRLLEEAGHPMGKGIPPLEIWTASKSESVQLELAAYQKYLGAVGIMVTPRVADDWKHFVSLIDAKKVPLFYAAWYGDYPDPDNFLYVLFHSKSRTNRMGYANPIIDQTLEEARREMDYMKRVEIYREAQRLIMSEAPVITQHVNSFNYLFQPWVKGVEISYLGGAYIPFRKVWIDFKTTQ
ncbi:ABC transporter substrate-binding protein [Desulfococcus sp.]|uniref:ABC transporter substrate-binding protein n=1 Tax=Desulfococcus sp. TaxID=2025834 RepID=UPI0035945A62